MANRWGNNGNSNSLFSWAPKSLQMVTTSHEIKRCLLLGRKVMTNLDSILKSRDIPLPTKAHLVKAIVFPVVMYGCQSWTIKKAEHWKLDAFELRCWERTLESPLDSKEIKAVHPKGNQPWIFIERTDAEAPILWPPDAKSRLTGKDPDAGKDWRWEKKGMTEDETVGWYHRLNGHELWISSRSWWWTGHAALDGVTKSLTWLSDWIELNFLVSSVMGNFYCFSSCAQ